MRSRSAGEALVLCWAAAACAPRASPVWRQADAASWPAVRQALESERAARPRAPWSAAVRVAMREPRSGREIDGRGAVAVAPGEALRMILLGPAGVTLLDAWVTADRWRVAVPPAEIVRRGALDEPDDLPVGFLRWSLFRPLEGTLIAGSLSPQTFVLRDGDAVVEVELARCRLGELSRTTRRVRGRVEHIEECRAPGPPRPGEWVRYEDERTGLRVELTFEAAAPAPPDERAFRDPDDAAPGADR
ncbi:MAG TPA: hypothetical protein VE987_20130 [Polyangiaceae bacterium]|nr:hypothetical protein [Polyangiaceae bacterium]